MESRPIGGRSQFGTWSSQADVAASTMSKAPQGTWAGSSTGAARRGTSAGSSPCHRGCSRLAGVDGVTFARELTSAMFRRTVGCPALRGVARLIWSVLNNASGCSAKSFVVPAATALPPNCG